MTVVWHPRSTNNAPLSVRAGMTLVCATGGLGWSAALDTGDRIYECGYLSEDGQDGPAAFRDRRTPGWKGC